VALSRDSLQRIAHPARLLDKGILFLIDENRRNSAPELFNSKLSPDGRQQISFHPLLNSRLEGAVHDQIHLCAQQIGSPDFHTHHV